MSSRKLYYEGVRVGEELPVQTKSPVDRVQLARYAGASGDFNPVHVDETYAKGLGMPSVYAPGMLIMGFLGQLVSDWARGAQLRRYSVKFSKIIWPGDTVVCKGRVTERWGDAGRYFAELDLWAENQKGELVLRGAAEVQLFHSLDDENRQRSGQPPLVVPAPKESILPPPPAPARKEPSPAVSGVKKAAPRESPAVRKPAESARKSSKK
jgi:acyl dehydratase